MIFFEDQNVEELHKESWSDDLVEEEDDIDPVWYLRCLVVKREVVKKKGSIWRFPKKMLLHLSRWKVQSNPPQS